MNVLITGGLGYIGAHLALELKRRDISFDVIDNSTTLENFDLVQGLASNLWNRNLIELSSFHPRAWTYDAIVHLAAFISVEESVRKPAEYWDNNINSLLAVSQIPTDHLIFASTGTAFNPTSPYANTKVAGERYILDSAGCGEAKGHTIFRFYNVSGLASGVKPTGQPTHLIRMAAMAARREIHELSIFGNDYPTLDGTAVRDYIDVRDVAASIANAIEAGPANTAYECLGSGTGYSVLDVVSAMQEVSGEKITLRIAPRRPGDAASMMCPSQYQHIRLSRNLHDMCLSAYLNV